MDEIKENLTKVTLKFEDDDNLRIHAFSLAKIKNGSSLSIGDKRRTFIPVDQHFNWFQKLIWRWCLGVKVEDYNEE